MSVRAVIAFLIVLGSGFAPLAGAEIVQLEAATSEVSLTPFLQSFRDASGVMTVEDVRGRAEQAWAPPDVGRRPAFGFTRDAIWLRFRMRHLGPTPTLWIVDLESTRLDTLDAYVVRSGVVSEHFVTGNLRPAAPRMLDYLRPAFPVPLQPGEEVEFLLRVHTETSSPPFWRARTCRSRARLPPG
ncbi:MAG: hypothetical protein LW690_07670 [Opitutaceae bacterium]|nr:hypothetical protein [Opitutaceae bacterium]